MVMFIGLILVVAATFYIMVVTFLDIYCPIADDIFVAAGCFGCVLIIAGIVFLHKSVEIVTTVTT